MSIVTSLLNKLEFIGGIELTLVKLENKIASIPYLTSSLHLGTTRAWYAERSAREYERSAYARRAACVIPFVNSTNR